MFTALRFFSDDIFPYQSSLVTETFISFYDELCQEDLRWALNIPSLLSNIHSTVITGQPGIGMSAAA